MPNWSYVIYFDVRTAGPEKDAIRVVIVEAMAENAPDALIAAVTACRQTMQPEDGFHMIHVGAAAAAPDNQGIPFARITSEEEIAAAVKGRFAKMRHRLKSLRRTEG